MFGMFGMFWLLNVWDVIRFMFYDLVFRLKIYVLRFIYCVSLILVLRQSDFGIKT